jgi:hypothetical protein
MNISGQEEKLLSEIEDWEEGLFNYIPNDIEQIYSRWIESSFEDIDHDHKNDFFNKIDNYLFHLHAFIQNSRSIYELKQQYVRKGRIFDETIETIPDLKMLSIDQLMYINDQHIARQRMISLVQGGLTGYHPTFATLDLPSLIAINLRSVQTIAIGYGCDIQIPSEMMLSLKVFHAATLPKRLQGKAWSDLFEELKEHSGPVFFYEGNEDLTELATFEMPLKHLLKVFFLKRMRNKQKIPILSSVIGAGLNYNFSKNITNFAQKFYQKRLLLERLKHSKQ